MRASDNMDGEVTNNKNGVAIIMLEFLKDDDIRGTRVKKAEPEWTIIIDSAYKEGRKLYRWLYSRITWKWEGDRTTCMRSGRRNYGSLPSMDRQSTDETYQTKTRSAITQMENR